MIPFRSTHNEPGRPPGLLGSTGTYAYQPRAERRRAVIAASEQVDAAPLMVGIGAAVSSYAPVSYTPLTEDEVFKRFATVARAVRLPSCIHDNPATTHFTLGPGRGPSGPSP